jgi:hypothetical protein
MSNRERIWASRSWNMNFWHFSSWTDVFLLKSKVDPFEFWVETRYFLKALKIVYNTVMCNRAKIWVLQGWNMDFLLTFTANRCFLKNWRLTLWVLRRNSIVFKTNKNLCRTQQEYGPHRDEIQIFNLLSSWIDVFQKTTTKANPFVCWAETRYF